MFQAGGTKFKIKLFLMIGLTLAVVGAGAIPLSKIFFPSKEEAGLEATDQLQLSQLYQAVEEIEKKEEFNFQSGEVTPRKEKEEEGIEEETETLNIKILNGSGATGAAGDLKDKLTAKGVSGDISLGNAEDIETTLVQIKKNISQTDKSLILNAIKEDYPDYQEEELDSDSTSDVIIILGGD